MIASSSSGIRNSRRRANQTVNEAVASDIITSPAIELRQFSVHRRGVTGYWTVGWKVKNKGAKSLRLTAVRLPHGQFRSPERLFEPAMELLPGAAAEFQTEVHCDEAPGVVTENAFVIFNATWLHEDWRIFVRVRVVVDRKGEPESATELITTQKVGFSGVPN